MLKKVLFILLSLIFVLPYNAFADNNDITAASYVVIDKNTNIILAEKNCREKRAIASTTKVMTCYIACEYGDLDNTVTITNEMLDGTHGTLIYLKPGDKITLIDLVKGAMLASGNDAANAIACYVSGNIDSFVAKMNSIANNIGMNDTEFVTPSGLDSKNHHSTAYDMALLTSKALNNSNFASICSLKSAEIIINGVPQTIYNHNKLLSYDDCFVGVKTGYTNKAGRCLISDYKYNENEIITVTLNDPDDWNSHKKLLESAKASYINKDYTDCFDISVVGSDNDYIKCTSSYSTSALGELIKKAYYYPIIYAPIRDGEVVGKEEIYCNSILIMTVDIIVRKDL